MANEVLTQIAAAEREAATLIAAAREKREAALTAAKADAERRLAGAQSDGQEAGRALIAESVRKADLEAEQIRAAAFSEREQTLAAARGRMAGAVALIVERTVKTDGRS